MKKLNWINISIIFLLAVNATVFTMFVVQQQNFKKEFDKRPGMSLKNEPHPDDRFGDFVSSQLNFTPEQFQDFNELRQLYHDHARHIGEELHEVRKNYYLQLSSPEIDTMQLIDLSRQMGSLHHELKKETYRYYIKMRELCNNEQNEKLDSLMHFIIKNEMKPFGGKKHQFHKGSHGHNKNCKN